MKMATVLPPGRANDQGADVVKNVLSDLKAVVVDYLGGHVFGKLSARDRTDGETMEQWLPLERFGDLSEDRLCKRLKVFVFLLTDWRQRRKTLFEAKHGTLVTENPKEAEASAYGDIMPRTIEATAKPQSEPAPASEIFKGPEDGWRGLPLPERLQAAMNYRKLQRKDLARIFGVSPQAVTYWLKGLKLGEDLKDAKPIPEDLGRLMVHWLETGQEPTPEKLEALPSRSRTPRAGPKKTSSEAA